MEFLYGEPMDKLDIIVIDDDPITLEIIEDMLSTTEYRVGTYTGPDNGLREIAKRRPRWFITDYNMPGYSGQKLIIKVSEALVFGDCTFILLSAQEFSEQEQMLLATCGFTNVLRKPISKTTLMELVENVFRDR